MTLAILGWQIFIFITIGLAGRARGWVIAGWCVWTMAQVATLPLSIVQFLTIYFAYKVFAGNGTAAIPSLAVVESSTPALPEPVDPGLEERRRREAELMRREQEERERAESERQHAAAVRTEVQAEWARYNAAQERRARKAGALPKLLVFAGVLIATMAWIDASGVDGIKMVIMIISALGALSYLMRVLD